MIYMDKLFFDPQFSIFNSILCIGLLFLTGCFSEPDYPATPQIEFVSLQNLESKARTNTDSVVITLFFRDGDGDLGHECSNFKCLQNLESKARTNTDLVATEI